MISIRHLVSHLSGQWSDDIKIKLLAATPFLLSICGWLGGSLFVAYGQAKAEYGGHYLFMVDHGYSPYEFSWWNSIFANLSKSTSKFWWVPIAGFTITLVLFYFSALKSSGNPLVKNHHNFNSSYPSGEIKRLLELKNEGAITDEEFKTAKSKLLVS